MKSTFGEDEKRIVLFSICLSTILYLFLEVSYHLEKQNTGEVMRKMVPLSLFILPGVMIFNMFVKKRKRSGLANLM